MTTWSQGMLVPDFFSQNCKHHVPLSTFILNQNNLAGQTCISLKFCVVCESMNEKTSLIEEFQTGGERVCDRLKQEQRG